MIPFTKGHVEKTYDWVQNPKLRRDFLMRDRPNRQKHISYFNRSLADPSQKIFAILVEGRHIANCGFKNVVLHKEGEIWIYIGEENCKHKGIGIVATRKLIDYGFSKLDLKKIYLHVANYNMPAQIMYAKLGFKVVPLELYSEWHDKGNTVIRMEALRNS